MGSTAHTVLSSTCAPPLPLNPPLPPHPHHALELPDHVLEHDELLAAQPLADFGVVADRTEAAAPHAALLGLAGGGGGGGEADLEEEEGR